MSTLQVTKANRLSLVGHPEYNERWVQEQIAADPAVLGLGDLVLKDKERIHAGAGRLDLLLQNPDTFRRYEVELQLGKSDETHIIRTIEYWDIERKRYPQYDHCAVIIAEEITSRFLNVISLFNGTIPLIALQLSVLQIDQFVTIAFTKVLDEVQRGLVDEDEEVHEIADRSYWENRGSKQTVALADQLLAFIKTFAPGIELTYKRHYIGMAVDGRPINFVILRPRKTSLNLDVRLPVSDDVAGRLDQAGLEVMEYDQRSGAYRLRLAAGDLQSHGPMLRDLLKAAYDERSL